MFNPNELLVKIDNRLGNLERMLMKMEGLGQKDLSQVKYSIKEAAEILGVIPLTIRNHIKNGTIKAEQIGRKYTISHSELYNPSNEVKSLKYKR